MSAAVLFTLLDAALDAAAVEAQSAGYNGCGDWGCR
jgi:hypothetical protein